MNFAACSRDQYSGNQSLATVASSYIGELHAGSMLDLAKCTASATVGNAANRPPLYSNRLHFLIISYTGPTICSNRCVSIGSNIASGLIMRFREAILLTGTPCDVHRYIDFTVLVDQVSQGRCARQVHVTHRAQVQYQGSQLCTMTRKLIFYESGSAVLWFLRAGVMRIQLTLIFLLVDLNNNFTNRIILYWILL